MSLLSPEEQQTAAEAAEGGIAPAGVYICRVSVVEKWSSGTSLVWKFKVAKGQPLAGHEFWDFTGLSEKGIWKTKAHLTSLGFPLDASEDDIIGTPCQVFVEVGTRTDTGEPKNKVVKVVRYEGPVEEEDGPDADLDAVFGAEDEGLI